MPEVEVPEMPAIDQKLLDEHASGYKAPSTAIKSYLEPKDNSKADKPAFKSFASILTGAIVKPKVTPQDDAPDDAQNSGLIFHN